MKFRIVLIALIVGLVQHVYACKCGGPWTVEEEFEDNELILYGKVLSKRLVSIQETLKQDEVNGVKERLKGDTEKLHFFETYSVYEIKLVVREKYKGIVLRDTVTIFTTTKSASCGFNFEKGKLYIVYASKLSDIGFMFLPRSDLNNNLEKENTFWTNHCTRTTKYNKKEADQLRKLKLKRG